MAARRRELGVRMALGATPGAAIGVVARGALVALGVGLLAGIPAALAVARLFASRLYGIGPGDAASVAFAATTLAAAALLALAWPAIRAARVHPAEVLRAD